MSVINIRSTALQSATHIFNSHQKFLGTLVNNKQFPEASIAVQNAKMFSLEELNIGRTGANDSAFLSL